LQIDQIIKGCKKQKPDCQKLLYQQNYSLMMSICSRYGNTVEDAEEMLNNGFLKIFVHINQFENKGSFDGWMKRVMVNSCLDYIKSKQFKLNKINAYDLNVTNENDFFEKSLYNQGVYSEIEFDERDDVMELLKNLNELPEVTKTVFNLFVFEEYTHKEISTVLHIAERTSQLHLSNAKKVLVEIYLKKNIHKKVVGL
jgi:RNA polymerase sigma factor (sigma-70 family)